MDWHKTFFLSVSGVVSIWIWWLLPLLSSLSGAQTTFLGYRKGNIRRENFKPPSFLGWLLDVAVWLSYSPPPSHPFRFFLLTPSTGFPSAKTPLTIPTLHEKPAGVSLSLSFGVHILYTDLCAIQPVGGWWLGNVLKRTRRKPYTTTSRSWVSVENPFEPSPGSALLCLCLCETSKFSFHQLGHTGSPYGLEHKQIRESLIGYSDNAQYQPHTHKHAHKPIKKSTKILCLSALTIVEICIDVE
jgi:hypothetical protein